MVNWKAALVLLAVVVGLVVYVGQPRAKPAPVQALIPCDTLNTVYLRVEGAKTVEVARATPQDAWILTQPLAAPGDGDAMRDIILNLNTNRTIDTLSKPMADSAYGLVKPRLNVTCRVNSGASYTLSVGDQSFDGSGYFARKAGDVRVYVVSSIGVDRLDRALAEPPVRSPSPAASPGGGPSPSK